MPKKKSKTVLPDLKDRNSIENEEGPMQDEKTTFDNPSGMSQQDSARKCIGLSAKPNYYMRAHLPSEIISVPRVSP